VLNAIAKSMKHATKEAIMQIPAAMLLFISWRTSKSTQPYQRGRASITGLGLKLRKSM
jgi:hypothetical protein